MRIFISIVVVLISWQSHASLRDDVHKAIQNSTFYHESHHAVYDKLRQFGDARVACELNLDPGTSNIELAPNWLIQLAKTVFIDHETLPDSTIAFLKAHKFTTEIDVKTTENRSNISSQTLQTLIRSLLIDMAPQAQSLGKFLRIDISNLQVRLKSDNSLSFKLKTTFDNQETQLLQFRDMKIGSLQPEAVVAKIVVASILHREIVSSDYDMRREMNALRLDILKLMRVVEPDLESGLAELSHRLIEAQPNFTLWAGWMNGSPRFLGADTRMGRAFATYLEIKEELLITAQVRQDRKVRTAPSENVEFVRRESTVFSRGALSSGYYANRRLVSERHLNERTDDSEVLATMIWFQDPWFMFTHPLYIGVKDRNPLAWWMMMDWMRDPARSTQAVFPERPYNHEEQNWFERPVEPVYTRNTDRPVLSPWDPEASRVEQINVNVAGDGSVTWTSANDQKPVDTHVISEQELADKWSQVDTTYRHGRDVETPTPTRNVDLSQSPEETERFVRGADGSGFSDRDDSIVNH